MKRIIGLVLFIAGLVASLIFGLQAYQDTESIKFLGANITVSQANWTPLIISLVVTVVGIILIVSHKPKRRSGRRN